MRRTGAQRRDLASRRPSNSSVLSFTAASRARVSSSSIVRVGATACGRSSPRSSRSCAGVCTSRYPNRDVGWAKSSEVTLPITRFPRVRAQTTAAVAAAGDTLQECAAFSHGATRPGWIIVRPRPRVLGDACLVGFIGRPVEVPFLMLLDEYWPLLARQLSHAVLTRA